MSYKEPKHLKSAWSGQSHRQDKSWGHEVTWTAFDTIHGKILSMNRGGKTSFKKHQHKNEVFYILTGKVKVFYGDELSLEDVVAHPFVERVLKEGEVLFVQSNCPYQITALEDSKLIEIGDKTRTSTVYLDRTDSNE